MNKQHKQISNLMVKAFENHPHSHQTEGRIVEELRSQGALLFEIIEEQEGQIIGYCAFSPATIQGKSGKWAALGPVAVHPEIQKHGIGSRLIRDGLEKIKKDGYDGCVLVGDRNYYSRFGFKNFPKLTVSGIPQEYVMAYSFHDDIPEGEIIFHPAFFVE